jgi:hypothetical protein
VTIYHISGVESSYRVALLRGVLLLCVLALFGCSMLRVGYRQADSILAWKANQYFDFDGSQKHEFRARLDRLLVWHHREQLPEYAAFLSAAKAKAQKPLTRADIVWFVEGIKTRYRAIVNRGAGDAAEMLATLTPENVHALEKQFARDNREFVREYRLDGTREEQRRESINRTLKQVKDWTGSLTREQEDRIAAMSRAIPLVSPLRHQDRVRRQKEFLELLELRGKTEEFAPRLRRWLLNWEEGRSPEYERLLDEAYEKRIAMFMAIDRMLTPHQRATVLNRLQDYIDDCKALSDPRVNAASN